MDMFMRQWFHIIIRKPGAAGTFRFLHCAKSREIAGYAGLRTIFPESLLWED